jgi:hypothetical protein
LLVVIDDFIKSPLVEPVAYTSSILVCKTLDKIFSMFGTPVVERSDNGGAALRTFRIKNCYYDYIPW